MIEVKAVPLSWASFVAPLKKNTIPFRYIRSKSNSADTLTTGIDPQRLTNWLAGPSFL